MSKPGDKANGKTNPLPALPPTRARGAARFADVRQGLPGKRGGCLAFSGL